MPQEIQKDFNQLQNYTELPYRYFGDGSANIIAALKYAANPTISQDAITPHYWANYDQYSIGYHQLDISLYINLLPSADDGDAYLKWPELTLKSGWGANIEEKPFV